ncbi:MAG: Nif3-like dinuclear metal center hexameric protein [Clostridium sp.]
MRCSEVIKILNELAPISMACEWDNPGLLVGRNDKEVKAILLALDVTDSVIDEAIKMGAGMIVSHHPLIFKPIKKINDGNFIGKRLIKLIQHDISCYAMHTNFDAAPGCMADLAANCLELKEQKVLEVMGTDEVEYGIGKYGYLEDKMTLQELANRVKEVYHIPFVTIYGDVNCIKQIEKVAICPGSGSSTMKEALNSGAEVYISGDIGHHDGIDAVANGMAVIDAGHYGIEHIFMEFMETFLDEKLDGSIIIRKAADAFPNCIL